MIKKQKKWIALLVTLTFMWLLQVSAMPLAATGPSERIASASVEQGPDYYAAVAQKADPAKKKSILPWILIGVGVVGIAAAVLFLFVLKGYNITGSWTFVFTLESETEIHSLTFTGDKKSGTFLFTTFPAYTGPYALDGKNVTMTLTYYPTVQFSGAFTGKDEMTGTFASGAISWNWTATRNTGTSTSLPTPAVHSRLLAE